MIGSILQNCLLLNFLKVSRRVGDSSVEETELLKRKRGAKFNPVSANQANDDNVSEKLFFVTEYEPSYAYISSVIESIKKRMYIWSGNLLRVCHDAKIRTRK